MGDAELLKYREAALADIDPKQNPERARFEDWYVTNAFDYARDPIGSQRCALQWAAWKGAIAPRHPHWGNVAELDDEA
jgi:hypothetical protein